LAEGLARGYTIHLEAATFSKPVVFGPNYKKFKEANDLINSGSGFAIKNFDELNDQFTTFFSDGELVAASGQKAFEYVNSMRGATKTIMEQVF
jgi:3-deoxy-D-manno-octulosonic-acid transferase